MAVHAHNALPGVASERTYQERFFLHQAAAAVELAHVGVIDGEQSRDAGNTGNVDTLLAGLAMGIITASGKWAPAFVGLTTASYTSGGTTLTVSAAGAVELDRLVGQAGSGELVCIGAPTSGGTVAVTAFDHSAINTSNGQITCTSLGVNKHSGAIIAVNDGRYTPRGFVGEGYGLKVTDQDAQNSDVQLGKLVIGGLVKTAQVINYPASANTGLIAWLKSTIKGHFLWSDDFGV